MGIETGAQRKSATNGESFFGVVFSDNNGNPFQKSPYSAGMSFQEYGEMSLIIRSIFPYQRTSSIPHSCLQFNYTLAPVEYLHLLHTSLLMTIENKNILSLFT